MIIGNSVTSIGVSAFSGCSSLTSVIIGNSVTSIGSYAFSGCSGLTSVTIPNSVISIDESAFRDCSSLTSVTIPNSVTSIGSSAFSGCSSLTSVIIGNSVTSIGKSAFSGCSGLTSVAIPNSVTSIGDQTFHGCSDLTSVTIGNSVTSIGKSAFSGCSGLTSVTIGNSVTSIGENAFSGCSGLKEVHISDIAAWCNIAFNSVDSNPLLNAHHLSLGDEEIKDLVIPEGVTAIKNYAFYGCSGLTSVTIGNSVTSIGSYAFYNCSGIRLVEMKSELAPECASYPFTSNTIVVIPDGAYDSYSQATYWKNYVHMFTEKGDDVKTVTIEAADAESSLHKAIGEENLAKVVDLTINGSINSYDFMVMRNKMTLLRKVDMSNAKIVYNAYEHYTGCHTENDQFPDYAFYNSNLISVNLPKDITSIGSSAFNSCSGLTSVTIPNSVTSIGGYAFQNCSDLTSVAMGNSVTSIGKWCFYGCSDLTSVIMGNSVTSIGNYAFNNCSKLSSIKLPPSLKTIGYNAFYSCGALTEIRIPASVRTLGDEAFLGCHNLKSVYVYTVEPISISQNTFGFGADQVLYAPKVSYTTYWYNTQWSQFKEIREFDEPYENFYLNGDKELDNSTGAIEGEGDNNPDAEMGSGSGLIVGGDVNQDLGDVEIENGGSIIVDGTGEVNADKLHFHINVTGGKWYFFCFPFDIKAEDIKCKNGSDYVFRYYDGEERAKNGKGGWKNVTSDGSGNFIKAGRGYIFQSSANDVLCITVKNGKIKKEDKYNELVEFITQNVHDASWNFVGNPYLSYYEVTNEDYNAPITIWNGSGYEAIRPGDDDYHLAPFEAFFVQKPNGEDQVSYDNDRQMTKKQSDKKKAEKAAEARMRGGVRMLDNGRKMVNITLNDGTATDRTRVVFNESVSMDYEMECDAAKFASAGIPQLYTLDSKQVKYAINERPVAEGMVAVGYSVENQGVYTIAAQRMDTQMVLKDNLTGKIHDFATDGDYTFMTEAGTFDVRFALMLKDGEATGIEGVEGGIKVEAVDGGVAVSGSGNALVNVYNAGGAVVASQNGDGTISLPAGTYIVSAGEKNVKVTLK